MAKMGGVTPMIQVQLDSKPPVIAYAQLLREMHRLIKEGKGDSEEAEALADRMDSPWYAMTVREQSRMRGLAADLHALRDSGPRKVDMTPEQLTAWQEEAKNVYSEKGDVDAILEFLRCPIPSTLPDHVVPFLQARSWEKLGDLDTALVFDKAAGRLDPTQTLPLLPLLQDELRQLVVS
jgi:hypothetical protein